MERVSCETNDNKITLLTWEIHFILEGKGLGFFVTFFQIIACAQCYDLLSLSINGKHWDFMQERVSFGTMCGKT